MENKEILKLIQDNGLIYLTFEKTVKLIKRELPDCKIAVGGAVLIADYAEKIGAEKYCADAMQTVRYAEEIFLG